MWENYMEVVKYLKQKTFLTIRIEKFMDMVRRSALLNWSLIYIVLREIWFEFYELLK